MRIFFNFGTGAVHPLDNGQGDDRPEPDIFIGKPDLTQQAYAGIGKGMSPSYVWVAKETCQRSRFPSTNCWLKPDETYSYLYCHYGTAIGFPLKMPDSVPDGQHSSSLSGIGTHTAAVPLYYNTF